MTLFEVADGFISNDSGTKLLRYYVEYDSYFRKNGIVPKTILEVGVYKGESTKVFAKCFPDAKIVGIDLNILDIDFSGFSNIRYFQCDQIDKSRLESIIREEFPDGIDVVTEDASHIGALSAMTFEICFPFLKSGGVYVVEDWATGYWDSWPDGGRFQEYPLNITKLASRLTVRGHHDLPSSSVHESPRKAVRQFFPGGQRESSQIDYTKRVTSRCL